MAILREPSKEVIYVEDMERRERLERQLSTVSIYQLPALEEWIKTGKSEAIASLYRSAILRDLYDFKGNNTAPLNKEGRFVSEFIRLMYIYFPDEPMWQDEEIEDFIKPHQNEPMQSRLSEQREKERQDRETSTKGGDTD